MPPDAIKMHLTSLCRCAMFIASKIWRWKTMAGRANFYLVCSRIDNDLKRLLHVCLKDEVSIIQDMRKQLRNIRPDPNRRMSAVDWQLPAFPLVPIVEADNGPLTAQQQPVEVKRSHHYNAVKGNIDRFVRFNDDQYWRNVERLWNGLSADEADELNNYIKTLGGSN